MRARSPLPKGRVKARKLYMLLVTHFFVGDASRTEVSVKGFRAGVPRRYEGTVGEAPRVEEFTLVRACDM